MNHNQKIILVFSTQRSGSTMVTTELTQTQILGNPGEYFIKKILPGSKFNNCQLDADEIKKAVENIIAKAKTANGVVSIKIMSNYIIEIAKAIEKSQQNRQGLHLKGAERKAYLQKVFVDFFNSLDSSGNFTAIRVYRQNKAKQAISRLVAGKTGLYHIVKNKQGECVNQYDRSPDKATPFSLDVDKFYNYEKVLNKIESIYNEEKELEILFKNFGINPLNLVYEEIAKDLGYIDRIILSLDSFEQQNHSYNIERKTVKTSSSINKEILAKFNADGGGKNKIKITSIVEQKAIEHLSLPHRQIEFNTNAILNSKIADFQIDILRLNSEDKSFLVIGGILVSKSELTDLFLADRNSDKKYDVQRNLRSDYFGSVYWGINQSDRSRFKCLFPLRECKAFSDRSVYNLSLNYAVDGNSPTEIAKVNIASFLSQILQTSQH